LSATSARPLPVAGSARRIAAVLLLPCLLAAQPPDKRVAESPVRLLVRFNMLGGSVGASRLVATNHRTSLHVGRTERFSSYDFGTVGFGVEWRHIGILFEAASDEGYPWGFAGAYGGWFHGPAAYLKVVYGASGRAKSLMPSLYAYSDLKSLSGREYSELHFGIGAQWRYYVVSPDLRVSWQRMNGPERVIPPYQYDMMQVSIGLELGGLWAVDLRRRL